MNHIADIDLSPTVWHTVLALLAVVAVLALAYLFYIRITSRMARKRHRDPLGWVLLSLLVSPMLTWIILLIVGDSAKKEQ